MSQGGRLHSLSRAELQELTLLYRQTAADLSTLREDPSGAQLSEYVNRLLGRAHNTIYFGKRGSFSGIWRFYRNEYPALFRRNLRLVLLAFALFALGGVAGTLTTIRHPQFLERMVPPTLVQKIERKEMWTDSIVAVKPMASSSIATNNLSVSFAAFAFGITGGVITTFMMLFNGLLMGVIGTACAQAGMSLKLWSFVAPHGALELPAIFIAGAGGFRIAQGMLFPGTLPRGLSLARSGLEAVKLLFGVIPMLLIAGVIEGFFSPSNLPVGLKFAVSAALATLLVLYLYSRPAAELRSSKPEPLQ